MVRHEQSLLMSPSRPFYFIVERRFRRRQAFRRSNNGLFQKGQTPESDTQSSYCATRRYTKVHLGFCLRFSTLIGQIGHVPLFGAGPRRYIRSRLLRLTVTAFWRARTASWRQKGNRKQIFPGAIRTTELSSNPSP